jgi:hypothetical protein
VGRSILKKKIFFSFLKKLQTAGGASWIRLVDVAFEITSTYKEYVVAFKSPVVPIYNTKIWLRAFGYAKRSAFFWIKSITWSTCNNKNCGYNQYEMNGYFPNNSPNSKNYNLNYEYLDINSNRVLSRVTVNPFSTVLLQKKDTYGLSLINYPGYFFF